MPGSRDSILPYQRAIDELIARAKRGEISEYQCLEGVFAALEKILPEMSTEELLAAQRWVLANHAALANDLAAHGFPVPGNDPGKPN